MNVIQYPCPVGTNDKVWKKIRNCLLIWWFNGIELLVAAQYINLQKALCLCSYHLILDEICFPLRNLTEYFFLRVSSSFRTTELVTESELKFHTPSKSFFYNIIGAEFTKFYKTKEYSGLVQILWPCYAYWRYWFKWLLILSKECFNTLLKRKYCLLQIYAYYWWN